MIIEGDINGKLSYDEHLGMVGPVSNKGNNLKGDAAKALLLEHKLYAVNTFPPDEEILEREFDPGITHESKEDWTKTWISIEMKQNREDVLKISKNRKPQEDDLLTEPPPYATHCDWGGGEVETNCLCYEKYGR